MCGKMWFNSYLHDKEFEHFISLVAGYMTWTFFFFRGSEIHVHVRNVKINNDMKINQWNFKGHECRV
jgi:hypothetical protein